jgi:outer membrane protein
MRSLRIHLVAGLLTAALLSGGSAARGAAPEPMNLTQAYDLAVERSETLKITEAEWRAAEARYREAVGAGWPEVRGAATANSQDVGGEARREDDTWRIGVGASWTLFNGFRTLRDAAARRAEGEAIRFDSARTRQLLYQDVADVFYLTLALEGEGKALEDQVGALTGRIEELDHRVRLGRSRKADLLSAQAQVSEARVETAQLEGQRAASLELLSFLTGKPAGELRPVDDTAMPTPAGVPRATEASPDRPDLLAGGKRVEAAEFDAKAARSERNVKADIGANVYAAGEDADAGDWDVVLRAELPLFDGGTRRARVAERDAQVEIRELRLAELRRTADRDVRFALERALSALAQWAALREALAVTSENYEIQRRDYELGRASNLDVLAALVQKHSLRRRDAVLEMQARAALVRLQVAAGSGQP